MIMPDSEAWMGSLYTSHPSQDSDNAWKELQTVRTVWVSSDEALRLNISSGLRAGKNTKATLLGVQHNLHCVVTPTPTPPLRLSSDKQA
ncbi:hypothetical protein MMC28_000138 [Mycoblastus sanguinarius]|nr:hypothetical protein [Mycoblastus sanguinarius]